MNRPRRSWLTRLAVTGAAAATVTAVLAAGLIDKPDRHGSDSALPVTLHPDRPAPMLAGTTTTGQAFDLGALRGTVVVINVMASWCPPCRVELPVLVDAARRWAPKTVRFVGIALRDDNSHARELAGSGTEQSLTVLADPDGTRSVSLGTRGVPETFVVDRHGVIRLHAVGPVTADWLDHALTETTVPT